MLEFSIITISTFVTVLNECVKHGAKIFAKKDISTYIPLFSIAFGLILGVGGYYTPDVDMGSNLIEAIFIGISAGAAATGINQIGRQLSKQYQQNQDPVEAFKANDLVKLLSTAMVNHESQSNSTAPIIPTPEEIEQFISDSTNVCEDVLTETKSDEAPDNNIHGSVFIA